MTDLAKMTPAMPWTCLCLSFLLWAGAPTRPTRAEPPRAEQGAAGAAPSALSNEASQGSAADSAPGAANGGDPTPLAAAGPATRQPAPAPVHKVHVHFSAKRGTLQVEAVGPAPERCTTPCTLLLPPGKTDLVISGDARFAQSIAIPDHETSVELSTRRRGRVITGGVFSAIGFVAASVGIATISMDTGLGATVGLCVTGLVGTITGLVLMRRAGHNDARIVESERPVAQSKAPRVSFAGVGVAPMLSHAGAHVSTGLRF